MTRPAPAPVPSRRQRVFALLHQQSAPQKPTTPRCDARARATQVRAFQTYAITSLRRSVPIGIGAKTGGDHELLRTVRARGGRFHIRHFGKALLEQFLQ